MNLLNGRTMMVVVIAVLVVAASMRLGWWGARRAWPEATGWNRIPGELRPAEAVRGEGEPWIRWLGHSGFVIYWHGQTLLVDPNLSGRCTVSRRTMELPPPLAGIGPATVLISHAHYDHLNIDTLAGIEQLESILIPAGSEVFLERLSGGRAVILPVEKDTTYTVGALRITPVRAAHNGNRFHPLRSTFAAVGYMISGPDGKTIYVAGDTAFANDWQDLRERFHPDLAILPIGAYAPRIPLKYHHLNPEEAARVAELLGAGEVIPCHFGTFTLSFDRPSSALPRFAAAAKALNLNWTMPAFLDQRGITDLVAMTRQGRRPAADLSSTRMPTEDAVP